MSPCLFNLCAEYITWNAGLDESQVEIKIPGRNMNNLRYADDTMLMVENEEEPMSLLMKMKEESEKAGLKFNIQKKNFNIQKTKIIASCSFTSWQVEAWRILFSCIPKSLWMVTAAMKLEDTFSLEGKV